MTDVEWMSPRTHLVKATEYLREADRMAATGGINAESNARLTVLARLAAAHTALATAKEVRP